MMAPTWTTARCASLLGAARSYTEQSPQWPIFPVDSRKKTPIIKTGKDHAANASTDPVTIERWILVDHPGCGIAMPTGAASGTIVIDADRKHDGEALLAALERALGPLSRDRTVRTQSGGLHVYLAHPGSGVRVLTGAGAPSNLGKLLCGRPGIDVRADGGIVVLPPSCGYSWISDDDEPLPPIPPLWLAAIQGAGEPPRQPRVDRRRTAADDDVAAIVSRIPPICDGERNVTLFRIGVRLRHDGHSESEILDTLERINDVRVSPSLPDREIQKIARSAARGA